MILADQRATNGRSIESKENNNITLLRVNKGKVHQSMKKKKYNVTLPWVMVRIWICNPPPWQLRTWYPYIHVYLFVYQARKLPMILWVLSNSMPGGGRQPFQGKYDLRFGLIRVWLTIQKCTVLFFKIWFSVTVSFEGPSCKDVHLEFR